MKKAEFIFKKLICGGIGYAPTLYRIGKKYYTIRGDVDGEGIKKLAELFPSRKIRPNGFTLWRRHKDDNLVTATQFLELLPPSRQ